MKTCQIALSNERYEKTKKYVFSMLGHPEIVVELDDDQFDDIIDSAIDYLGSYIGLLKYAYTPVVSGRCQYQVPADCHTVERIYFDSSLFSSLGNTSTALFSDFYLLASDLAVDLYESPVTFWSYLSSREMLQKVYGVWTDFEIVNGDQIRIYPAPHRDSKMVVKYRSVELDLKKDRYNIFRDYVLAKSKIIVGEIRSKYSGIQSSAGGSVGLNGVDLKNEGLELLSKIEKRVQGIDPLEFQVF